MYVVGAGYGQTFRMMWPNRFYHSQPEWRPYRYPKADFFPVSPLHPYTNIAAIAFKVAVALYGGKVGKCLYAILNQ